MRLIARLGFLLRIVFLFLAGLAGMAQAHKPSDSYLSLKPDGRNPDGQVITGQWDIALRDLDFAIGLDADGNGEITWGELRARHAAVAAYALARLRLSVAGTEPANCPAKVTSHLVDQHSDGSYAVLRFVAECPRHIQSLGIEYRLFHDIDPQHKGLLRLELTAGTTTALFGPESQVQTFALAGTNRLTQFLDYLKHGIWHIWIGYDHILFLLSLLLPAVAFYADKRWQAVADFRTAFWDVFRIVTAFTVAHSITLTLAALDVIALHSRVVESAIALSVVLAAVNNIRPVVLGRRWVAAFGFGLIHGFGFASVLGDLGLPQDALLIALVAFNGGVEVGQLAIVAGFLPVAYALRHTLFYRRAVMLGGSALIIAVAGIWLIERVFDVKLISG